MDDRLLQIAAALWGAPAEDRGRQSPVFTPEVRHRGARASVLPPAAPPQWAQGVLPLHRSFEPPLPSEQQEPYGPMGPGGITNDLPAPRARIADVARPMTFADFMAPPPLPEPLAASGMLDRPGPNAGGPMMNPAMVSPRHNVPADAPYETTEAYRRRRGTPHYEAHYRAQTLPNGAAIRTTEPSFDAIPEPPLSARRPVQNEADDELDDVWRRAMVRVRLHEQKRQHAIRK